MDTKTETQRRWYRANWPPLAWLETLLKAGALGIGIVALFGTLSESTLAFPAGMQLLQWIVSIGLSLGMILVLIDRYVEREIVSMIFAVFNTLGHWGIVLALSSSADVRFLVIAFCGLMLLGDLVKLIFIKVHHFTARNRSRARVVALISIYIVGYALILLLELAR